MRIIGGEFKRRILAEFPGEDIRPTSDRAREAIFNILSMKIYGTKVLDLFCGSGALGLEAISRGAKEVTFNDYSKDSLNVLKKNIKTLNIQSDKYIIKNRDFSIYIDEINEKYDIIFIDPPYRFDYGEKALEKIFKKGLLNDNGVIVYERDKPYEGNCGFEIISTRKYGKAYITFLGNKDNIGENNV